MEKMEIIELLITLIPSITIAIATIYLAIFTKRYVDFTHELARETNKLVTETKRMVDQMNMADVAVFFKNEKYSIRKQCNVLFCVKNVGTQTIRKVRIDVDPSFKANNTVIADIKWVKNGINVLPPGEVMSHSIYRSSKAYEPNESKTEIKIKYEDIFKREQFDNLPLDPQEILEETFDR